MPAPVALALSPHLDDAAFSCGGMLARLARSGWRIVVATAFTRSVRNPAGFALACQTDKGIAADVDYMALRRAEDAAAMAMLGAEPIWLNFPEAPHRGYGSAVELFGEILASDDMEIPLADAIRALLAELAPRVILAPQAIGGHVDHLLLVRALDRVVANVKTLWWNDFPYSARPQARQPLAARFRTLEEIDVDIAGTEDLRHRACAAYASQLGFQFGGAAGLAARFAEAGTQERFRVSSPMPSTAS